MQPDFNQLMRQAQKAQQALERLQGELALAEIEGSSGGGAVQVTCTGTFDFKRVKIKSEAVDPNDVETLEDLVLMAIRDALEKAKKMGQDRASQSIGMQLPPGMGMGF
jgi:DNA-binding YbaB/EbfC family protein